MNLSITYKKKIKKINYELNHIIHQYPIVCWAIQLRTLNLHLNKLALYNNAKITLTFEIKVITNSNPRDNNHCIITSDSKTNLKM